MKLILSLLLLSSFAYSQVIKVFDGVDQDGKDCSISIENNSASKPFSAIFYHTAGGINTFKYATTNRVADIDGDNSFVCEFISIGTIGLDRYRVFSKNKGVFYEYELIYDGFQANLDSLQQISIKQVNLGGGFFSLRNACSKLKDQKYNKIYTCIRR